MNRESLLFHRDFRLLWSGDAISQVGTMITLIAMPLLAVRTLHATPFQVGLLAAFEFLAFLVIGLPVGAWVDRMRKRNVMIIADFGRVVTLGSVPTAALLGVLTIWQLYAVALLTGALTVFFDVSYQSYLPFLVGRERLVEGNAKLQATQSVAQVAGPSVGGLLVQLLTAPYAIATDAASYLASALWVGAIRRREPRPQRTADADLLREIREGVAFIFRDPILRAVAGCTGTTNLWSSGGQAMLIVLLARTLDLSAGVIGALMSVGAIGGLLGALSARRLADWLGEGPLTWMSVAAMSPPALLWPFLHRDWTLGLFVVAQLAMFAGNVIYNITQVSFRQRVCPKRLLGRMNASMRFLVWGPMPIGALLAGALGSAIGIRAALLVSAIGSSLAFLWVYFSPLRWLREVPGEAENLATEDNVTTST
ncbi:MAG TPA: MFS transporter [Streptosporangiaceae bacterium]|nr:MFS transporter [Streptosporangiaceae bacterium]